MPSICDSQHGFCFTVFCSGDVALHILCLSQGLLMLMTFVYEVSGTVYYLHISTWDLSIGWVRLGTDSMKWALGKLQQFQWIRSHLGSFAVF